MPDSFQPSRRQLLAGVAAIGVGTALVQTGRAGAAAPADAPALSAADIHVTATAAGTILVDNGQGQQLLVLDRVYVTGSVSAVGGTAELVSIDGAAAIRVTYTMRGTAAGYACIGLFTVTPGQLHATFDITAPDNLWADGTMVGRRHVPVDAAMDNAFYNEWNRSDRGGEPFQTPLGRVYRTTLPGGSHTYEISKNNNPGWTSQQYFAQPADHVGTGAFRLSYTFVAADIGRDMAAHGLSARTLALTASSPQPFNLFRRNASPLTFTLTGLNSAAPADATLTWRIVDFYGTEVSVGSQTWSQLSAAQQLTVTTPKQPRGIYFLEATLTAGEESVLTRMNLTVLPDWTNTASPRQSKFGIAAYFLTAGAAQDRGREDWLWLLSRLGVRRTRVADLTAAEAKQHGLIQDNHHSATHGQWRTGGEYPDGTLDTVARAQKFAQMEQDDRAGAAVFEEFANEWNLAGALTGARAPEYVHDYLIPLDEYFKADHVPTKVCAMGIGGPDYVWLQKLVEEGGWPHAAAVALHPGRGNFTPDWAPAPDTWEFGSNGSYWNFLGGVRKIKADMALYDAQQHTKHDLLLTEVYAPTFPNSWWEDTYRTSAENVLLTAALCYAENVHSFYWYQLNDGVWYAIDKSSSTDREFHFGLVMVDTSLKPAALAYATAAEHLGDAHFLRWLTFHDPDLRGLLFDTPRGPLQVLWTRADGHVLNADHSDDKFYPTPEPWVDVWPTKVELRVSAADPFGVVEEIDCIGTRTVHHAQGRKVSLRLDGAARMFYGLAAD